ncbi:diguanylate cyclase (GGDEF)-like protein [Aquisalibacillus elongatus]|uniref:Diguanylate cyclase (GGDEF)-like protein n=1 Tax=Aquisalibacillus elongatus TaxID=485577 RepID=A0A3N5B0J0_9BACI|nr:diguanylate cyclase (GGDEF)-like protein [Aquisalibacillus elongatus]
MVLNKRRLLPILYISLALAISWVIVYTFRPNTVTVHLYYFPIILSAWFFKAPGGIISGLLSGFLAGPFMMLEVTENVNQLTVAWIIRLLFFSSLGAFVGLLFHRLQAHQINMIQQNERIIEQTNMANTDSLTSIPNRRKFDQVLQEIVGELSHKTTSLIILDIDHFKQFNDSFGHPKGDECLIEVAKTIQSTLKRPTDFFARYGGEEFVVILPNTDQKGALKIAESIRKKVAQLNIPNPNSRTKPFVTISLGAETFDKFSNFRKEEILNRADQALYLAKSRGRNQVVQLTSS